MSTPDSSSFSAPPPESSTDKATDTATGRVLVAVTGATGYVGGRLVPLLLEAGFSVRCIVREPRKLNERSWRHHPHLSVQRGDLSDPVQLAEQLSGCTVAYYLVHSMEARGKAYVEQDRTLAGTFAAAAASAKLQRIVYLGGLGEVHEGLSEHLSSRREVEAVLASTGIPVTVFRAAMIIGSGSASFEILRYLVERLPIMLTPSWVRTESQPIAIADVLHWLIRCISVPESAGKIFDIGGADVLAYRDLMRIMAEELHLPRRLIISLPVLTPTLSSGWISLITPVSYKIARPLAEGLRNRTVVTNDAVQHCMPHQAMSAREAIRRALERVRTNTVDTRWSVAGTVPGDPDWAGGAVFTDERFVFIHANPERVYRAVCRIGGGHGWYGGDVLWRIRGWMDTLVGGPGLRRGRRDPERVEFGEALDFWRVIGLERNRSLALIAEMKLPGIAALNFSVKPDGTAGRTLLTMTARFRPKGIVGILYWYGVLPLHNIVFGGMLRGIRREAEREAESMPENQQAPTPRVSSYGRARLWLGISTVGTMVTLASIALAAGLPSWAAQYFAPTLAGQSLMVAAFFLAYAAVQLPFDVLGGYALPRKFGRQHPPAGRFAALLLRGVAGHTLVLVLFGLLLLLAGREFGVAGVIGASAASGLILLTLRRLLAQLIAPLIAPRRSSLQTPAPMPAVAGRLPAQFLASGDEGFTGGIVGVFRSRGVILPQRWIEQLGPVGITVVEARRGLAVTSGSWARGRWLAMLFTLLGVALAAVIVGPGNIASASGIITLSLLFTLWSFVGLLILPTLSRSGVVEVDAGLRQAGLDPGLIDETILKLDALQDAEPERPVGIETIFHPIPSVLNRTEGPSVRNPRGFLDAARTSIFLSAAGLGLLGRAVHCNCGRPALWVFLPSD